MYLALCISTAVGQKTTVRGVDGTFWRRSRWDHRLCVVCTTVICWPERRNPPVSKHRVEALTSSDIVSKAFLDGQTSCQCSLIVEILSQHCILMFRTFNINLKADMGIAWADSPDKYIYISISVNPYRH